MRALSVTNLETTNGEVSGSAQADWRYRTLLGPSAWNGLPPAIRRRFSKSLVPGESAIYSGKTIRAEASRIGRWLARSLRIIGAPLPIGASEGEASVVVVTADAKSGGQIWTRIYARRYAVPQVIHSTKQFSGPTGLQEDIGYGLSIALQVSAEADALVFRSAAYRLSIFGFTWAILNALTPGRLTVSHREVTPDSFLFGLYLEHRYLGVLLSQEILFTEGSV